MEERRRTKISGDWIVETEAMPKSGYKITKIIANLAGLYFPIDTTNFCDDEWEHFHREMEAVL